VGGGRCWGWSFCVRWDSGCGGDTFCFVCFALLFCIAWARTGVLGREIHVGLGSEVSSALRYDTIYGILHDLT
jgi:hypothetical protein